MSEISRRDFLAGLTAAGAAVYTGRFSVAAEAVKIKRGSDVVKLGRSGLRPSLLGIGTGTVGGRQQRAIGYEAFTKLIRHALDRGIRYIDTADMYKTHDYVRTALEGVPRDKYFIQTKAKVKSPEAAKADIDRFLKELKVDYVDTLLMHCMTKATWPKDMRPVQDVLLEAKRQGKIRAMGISCHGWAPLAASVDAQEIDVQLARINPFGAKMDDTPEKVAAELKKMHERGRGVIGMKIYGEDGLGSRERRLQSLKYVLGLGSVDAFTIGFTSIAQLDETMELIEQAQAQIDQCNDGMGGN